MVSIFGSLSLSRSLVFNDFSVVGISVLHSGHVCRRPGGTRPRTHKEIDLVNKKMGVSYFVNANRDPVH